MAPSSSMLHHRFARPGLRLLLALLLGAGLRPPSAGAQALDAAAGAALGALGGGYLSVAVITANARAGRFVFSPDDLRWELLPIPVGALTAGVLAHRNPDRFWRTTGWGLGGLAAGALVGAAAGRAVWDTAEGTWSGAVLGGAVGVLAGALAGGLTWEAGEAEAPAPLTLSLRAPW